MDAPAFVCTNRKGPSPRDKQRCFTMATLSWAAAGFAAARHPEPKAEVEGSAIAWLATFSTLDRVNDGRQNSARAQHVSGCGNGASTFRITRQKSSRRARISCRRLNRSIAGKKKSNRQMKHSCFSRLSEDRQSAFQEKLRSLHPYEVPEIIFVPISRRACRNICAGLPDNCG